MIDELRQYTFTAESWEHYWKLFNQLCLPVRGNDFGALQGLWLEQVGATVTFRHIWRYESLDARARLRVELLKIDDWREGFLPQAARYVAEQHLQVLIPRAEGDGVDLAAARYLHVYRCPTGKAAGIIQQINGAGSAVRNMLCGLWATEFPNPNQIVAMTTSEAAPLLTLNAEVEIETRLLKPLDYRLGSSRV